MGSRGHTANPQRNPLWFLLNTGTMSAQQMLKLQMVLYKWYKSWDRCRRKCCTHLSIFLVPGWVRPVACSQHSPPNGPCSQKPHSSGYGPKVWVPLLNLCLQRCKSEKGCWVGWKEHLESIWPICGTVKDWLGCLGLASFSSCSSISCPSLWIIFYI